MLVGNFENNPEGTRISPCGRGNKSFFIFYFIFLYLFYMIISSLTSIGHNFIYAWANTQEVNRITLTVAVN